jgi:DNA-binding transcriptional LysR family regulator
VVVHHQALHSPQIVASLVLQEADLGYVFGGAHHPALQQEEVGQRRVVCVAPKGLFSAAELAAGVVQLADLAGRPMVGLDARDPLGITLAQVLRDHGVQLNPTMTVQTYHAALAMAQHGLGMTLVESCTAASADRQRVDVLPVAPLIPTAICALRPAACPNSLIARYFTQCFQQALRELD